MPVDLNAQPGMNADHLERALAQQRRALVEVADDEQRSLQAEAIEQMSKYVALLRNAASVESAPTGSATCHSEALRRPFWFKLEFPDGRWNVEEKELPVEPRLGDVVGFDDGRQWRVRASQLVRPLPPRKPAREFFVCAPAL